MQCYCGGKKERLSQETSEGITVYDKCSNCTWISIVTSNSPTTVAKALRHNTKVLGKRSH
jgi:hypothetical protein